MRRSRERRPITQTLSTEWVRLAFLVAMLAVIGIAMQKARDPATWRLFAPDEVAHEQPEIGRPRIEPKGPAANPSNSDWSWYAIGGLLVLVAARWGVVWMGEAKRGARAELPVRSDREKDVAAWLESDETGANSIDLIPFVENDERNRGVN